MQNVYTANVRLLYCHLPVQKDSIHLHTSVFFVELLGYKSDSLCQVRCCQRNVLSCGIWLQGILAYRSKGFREGATPCSRLHYLANNSSALLHCHCTGDSQGPFIRQNFSKNSHFLTLAHQTSNPYYVMRSPAPTSMGHVQHLHGYQYG